MTRFAVWTSCTLPETNIFAPENGWLEYDPFLLGWPIFRGENLSFREGNQMNQIIQTKAPADLKAQVRSLVPHCHAFLARGVCTKMPKDNSFANAVLLLGRISVGKKLGQKSKD